MANASLQHRRDLALGSGAELFYDTPLEIVRGEGVYLYDRDGRRYVDMYNNVPCVGHANPVVVQAMAKQQATVNVHSRYLHEGIVTFAERLAGLNHDGIESVVFSCSGTEAVEVGIQIARLATGNRGIVCTDATYHGNSELVGSLSYLGNEPPENSDVRAFPFPERYRPLEEGVSEEELCEAYLARVEACIENLKAQGPGFATLIMCSIFANEGPPDIPSGFMAKVTDLVHREGGLVIADEVQSGYGRTGLWWGYETTDFLPDIVVTGKPMGNGLPLGATAAKKAFIDAFRAEKDYFNTCAATPLQAAVGMAVLDEIERLDLIRNAAEVGDRLTRELKDRIPVNNKIGDARGYGLFIGVEMIKDKVSKEPDAKLVLSLSDRLKDKGFLTSYSGRFNNVLKIRPPLVFSHANADEFLSAFDECMGEISA
ncbi:MAG: aminotransferase class III-fold pyridoxal phosphate-dependent enzyme [Gammaproteobacteria bacterium]|nr:aminotransferase class III-fold pyridoxal phosphate-dependent enzyme [Gammaproteobacteria bacterium]